jgi:hypothetical protein
MDFPAPQTLSGWKRNAQSPEIFARAFGIFIPAPPPCLRVGCQINSSGAFRQGATLPTLSLLIPIVIAMLPSSRRQVDRYGEL